MEKIRIALCDDYRFLRDSYKEILELEPDFEVVGAAATAAECIDLVKKYKPDILLLDIQLETETAGVDIIPFLKELHSKLKIIMLSSYDSENYIFDSFSYGAANYILKDAPAEELIATVRDIYNDNFTVKNEIVKKLVDRTFTVQNRQKSLFYMFDKILRLSKTEIALLAQIHRRIPYKQIAKERFVEENTVRKTASNIFRKLEVKNTKELLDMLDELQIFELIKIDELYK